MASISRSKDGRRSIQFVAGDGRRRTIRIGKVSQRLAETIKVRVEALNASLIASSPLDNETAQWLASIGDELAEKLAKVGLIAPRASATLGTFTAEYVKKRTDVKPATIRNLKATRERLISFFGCDRQLRDLTRGDADAFSLWLRERYAAATASRTLKRARQFFKSAMRLKLVGENVFDDLKTGRETNESRKHFVSRETIERVIEACPDAEWRLIVALSRYGGLRCPSEHVRLQLADVDWERNRVRITSPKTEHHEGKADRWIPLYPELRPYLEDVFDGAVPGRTHFIERYRSSDTNLRTQFLRILRKAGVAPWTRLFQNLRASRETELAAQFPIHVVCAWMGNTALIAQKHYLKVRDEDFDRAAESGAVALQNAVQHDAALSRTASQASAESLEESGFMRDGAGLCEMVQTSGAPQSQPSS